MNVNMITDNKRIPVTMFKLLIELATKICYDGLITSQIFHIAKWRKRISEHEIVWQN